jgi:hypothetical protein
MTLDNWQKWGGYSFRRVDEILETADIENNGTTAGLEWVASDDPRANLNLSGTTVTLKNDGSPSTVQEIINATNTDGWMVLHRDEVVVEEYPGVQRYPDEYPGKMPEGTRHLLMSVTKSLTATVAGALQRYPVAGAQQPEWALDPTKHVTHYVEALKDSGYDGATVQDVLDMRSAIDFNEAYEDGNSKVKQMEAAAGWVEPLDDDWSDNIKDFLCKLTKDSKRDKRDFEYRSCETGVIGWVCEKAYQKANRGKFKPFQDLVSELLWSKLGAESDAYITVDTSGTGAFDGGICATLRDLARFGAMICRDGKSLSGQRVVSKTWVNDIFNNGSEDAFKKGDEFGMDGGKFRSMFWSPTGNRDVVICIGIHGQMVYINRATQTVGVKLSSWDDPVEDLKDREKTWKGFSALWMFEEISHQLQTAVSTNTATAPN